MPSCYPVAARSKNNQGDKTGLGLAGADATALLIAALAIVSVAVFDPIGWDQSGPIRWMAIPAIGFAAVALSIETTSFAGPHRPPSWLNPAHLWAALLLWGFVASVAAADPLHAWIGTPDRRFGWLIWLLCGGLFLTCRGLSPARTGAAIGAVTRAVTIAGLGLGLYTAAELAGLATDVEFAGNRAGGPFSQPAYLGAAAALVLPIAVGVAAQHRRDRTWASVGAAGGLGAGFALLVSQSRAAWLGALIAAAVWLVVRAMKSGQIAEIEAAGRTEAEKRSTSARLSAVLLGAPILLIVAIPALRARLTSSFGTGGVVQGRIDEWQVGFRALADAPLLGYGPEGYRTVFGRHVDQQYVIDWGRDVITDRAHAGALDVGLAFGLPGALLYLGLMAAVAIVAMRAMRSGQPVVVGLAVGTLAYAVQQQFFFPLSEVDPLFWAIAGLTFAASHHTAGDGDGDTSSDPSEQAAANSSVGRQLSRGLALGLAVVALVAGLADMAANVSVRAAAESNPAANPASGPEVAAQTGPEIETATNLRPDSIRYRFIASRLSSRTGDFDQAIEQLDRGLQRSPADPALRAERARLLLEQARLTPPGATESSRLTQSSRMTDAVSALRSLIDDDPNHPVHLQQFGIALALSGNYDEATAAIERAIELAPDRPGLAQNLGEIERLRASE